MANLTEVSIAARKFFIWAIFVFAGFIVLRIGITLGVQYWKATHPIPPPPPDVRFNKLPKPIFPSAASNSAKLKFTLLNIEGKPPETTDSARVYSLPKKLPTLLSPEKAVKFATKFGFNKEPDLVNSTYYHFTDPKDTNRTLILDTVNMNFKIQYDFSKNQQVFSTGQIQSKDQVINEVKNYISNNGIFDESIIKGNVTTDLLAYDKIGNKFNLVTNLQAADAIRINFFRQDINEWKILPPEFNKSYTNILYVPSPNLYSKIIEVSYTFWPIALDDSGTYPLKTGTAAWEELVNGYASVVNLGNNNPDSIVIRNIYIAYYDSEEPQLFLQPIFVFEGDNNFVAYLPAIISEYLE